MSQNIHRYIIIPAPHGNSMTNKKKTTNYQTACMALKMMVQGTGSVHYYCPKDLSSESWWTWVVKMSPDCSTIRIVLYWYTRNQNTDCTCK